MFDIEILEREKVQIDRPYKLTAIVLVYNGERYLRACLESLVNQTLDDLEILLINDASTDDSLSICMEYERDYDNVFIIDKKYNSGLASSANLGIRIAKGEYVILVDNDDIIPVDAYEKLYNKAKQTDADISIGQAILLHGRKQSEINGVEQRVWAEERVINDFSEFPTLFHDAFYWNKIIRRKLLLDNDIKLPENMIYADRKFSHTAYIHAKTISIIPDCVYMWRIRKNDQSDESLSIQRQETWNYINRIDSYELELDMLTDAYPDYFKILMKRVIVPIKGILDSKEFENAFYQRGVKLLKQECAKLTNVYDNDLYNIDNIQIYLALNDYKKELKDLLKLNLSSQRQLHDENGKTYWNLPVFRNPDIPIPDELFEVRNMISQFLSIEKLTVKRDIIIFEGIKLPANLKFSKAEIRFIGRSNPVEVIANNSFYFEIKKDEVYKAEIPTDKLRLFEMYDVFFRVSYEDRPYDEFRLNYDLIGEIKKNGYEVDVFATMGNYLVITTQRLYENFTIEADDEELRILVDDKSKVKPYLKIFVEDVKTGEKTYLSINEDRTEYLLKWEFFLDKKSNYSLNFKSNHEDAKQAKVIKVNEKYLSSFTPLNLKTKDNKRVKIYKNEDSNIVLKSS